MTYLNALMNEARKVIIKSNPTISKSYSVSGHISTTLVRPEIFTIEVHPNNITLNYQDHRSIIEDMHRISLNSIFELEIGDTNTPNLSVITRYQGDLTQGALNSAQVDARQASDGGAILRLKTLPTNLPQGSFFFRKGDYLQPLELFAHAGSNKIYRVANDVPATNTGNCIVGTHRPLYRYPATNTSLRFGVDVRWQVFLKRFPRYYADPRFINGITFDDPFILEENIS